MLTIQPKITNYTRPLISFTSDKVGDLKKEENPKTAAGQNAEPEAWSDEFFEQETANCKKQIQQYHDAAEDKDSPSLIRKCMKAGEIGGGAVLIGLSVAWGGLKGLRIIGSSVVKGAKSKFGKQVKSILRPVWHGIKDSGKKISEIFSNTVTKIKTSKFAEKFTNFVEKMRKDKFGKYIVKGFEYIGKAFKYVGSLIKKGFNKVADYFRSKPASKIYDDFAKGTAGVCGVGAGAADGYNAIIKEKKPDDKTDKTEEPDEENEDSSVDPEGELEE